MILVDYSGLVRATIAAELGFSGQAQVNEDMLRHMILNTIRSNVVRHREQFGEVVLALDGRKYWRRDVFPYYKHARKKHRDDSPLDWVSIFRSVDRISEELKVVLPYRVVQIDAAEADDVIAVIAKTVDEDHVIVSRDADFIQLQSGFGNRVSQWDPIAKMFKTSDDGLYPEQYLAVKIVKGDPGDGVPSVLVPDDYYATREKGQRAPSITKQRLEGLLESLPRGEVPVEVAKACEKGKIKIAPDAIVRNWNRNKVLIDLSYTPGAVVHDIETRFSEQAGKTKAGLLNYFMEHRLRRMTEQLNDF